MEQPLVMLRFKHSFNTETLLASQDFLLLIQHQLQQVLEERLHFMESIIQVLKITHILVIFEALKKMQLLEILPVH